MSNSTPEPPAPQDPYGMEPLGREPGRRDHDDHRPTGAYGAASYGADPYGADPYAAAGHEAAGYEVTGYGAAGYGTDPYGPGSHGPAHHGPNGPAPYGSPQPGPDPYGLAPSGNPLSGTTPTGTTPSGPSPTETAPPGTGAPYSTGNPYGTGAPGQPPAPRPEFAVAAAHSTAPPAAPPAGTGAQAATPAHAPESWHDPQPPATSRPRARGRDRYLDLLRALALLRVVVYHTFGWAWLTLLFPSMGVMFALAGSLMARSLKRPARQVLRSRVRRLLLPLWLYGVVVLTALFVQGWRPPRDDGGEQLWWWLRLACWVVPVGSPGFPSEIGDNSGLVESSWAVEAAGPLWYLRAYFWFVLLSPLLLRAFRRLPWTTLLAPLALTAVVGTGLVEIPGQTGEAVTDFAVYGSCWVLGFAHHDGFLQGRLPRYVIPSVAPLLMALGAWWASGHLGPDGWDLNDIPLAQALWSFGFCVLLLHVSPSWEQLPHRLRRFDKVITLANARAMTLYLWHEVALLAIIPLIDLLWDIPLIGDSPALSDGLEATYMVWMFLGIWPLILLSILAVGWAEDLAARRRPRLFPIRS